MAFPALCRGGARGGVSNLKQEDGKRGTLGDKESYRPHPYPTLEGRGMAAHGKWREKEQALSNMAQMR